MSSQPQTDPSSAGSPPDPPQNPCQAQIDELAAAQQALDSAVLARDEANAVVESCQQRVDAAVVALENCFDVNGVDH